jgi:protein farnesyltransferase/geranylgeranyltransferase type-1 subunit alpha
VAYSPEYKEVSSYFRAILFRDELSMRAYNLCEEVLKHNPGDYNAWAHRRKCIDELSIPLVKEIAYINSVGIELEKNFQIWHHRRCIMEMHQKDF